MVQPVYLFILTSMTSLAGTQKAGPMKTHTKHLILCYDMLPYKSISVKRWMENRPTMQLWLQQHKTVAQQKSWTSRILPLSHGNTKYVRWIEAWEATVCVCVCFEMGPWHSSSYWQNNSCSCLNVLCEHPHIFTQTHIYPNTLLEGSGLSEEPCLPLGSLIMRCYLNDLTTNILALLHKS